MNYFLSSITIRPIITKTAIHKKISPSEWAFNKGILSLNSDTKKYTKNRINPSTPYFTSNCCNITSNQFSSLKNICTTIHFSKMLCVHVSNKLLHGLPTLKNIGHLKRKSLNSQILKESIIHNCIYFCMVVPKNHSTKISILSIFYYTYYLYDCCMVTRGVSYNDIQ